STSSRRAATTRRPSLSGARCAPPGASSPMPTGVSRCARSPTRATCSSRSSSMQGSWRRAKPSTGTKLALSCGRRSTSAISRLLHPGDEILGDFGLGERIERPVGVRSRHEGDHTAEPSGRDQAKHDARRIAAAGIVDAHDVGEQDLVLDITASYQQPVAVVLDRVGEVRDEPPPAEHRDDEQQREHRVTRRSKVLVLRQEEQGRDADEGEERRELLRPPGPARGDRAHPTFISGTTNVCRAAMPATPARTYIRPSGVDSALRNAKPPRKAGSAARMPTQWEATG